MNGKDGKLANLFLVLLAVVFTVALTFATLELPRVLNRIIRENWDVPDIHPVIDPALIQEFMSRNHVRLVGYTCLAVVIILMVVGRITQRRGLS